MWLYGIVLLVLVLLGVVLFRSSLTVVGRRLGQHTADRMREAEAIVNQGRVPAVWVTEAREIADRSLGDVAFQQQSARKCLLRKIDRLREYFRHSPVCQDDDTRAVLLEQLAQARREWEVKDWQELLDR